jgi:hypothetical protein
MNIQKLLDKIALQIYKPTVKLPKSNTPHKIKDNNQSVNNGVINEKTNSRLRSQVKS